MRLAAVLVVALTAVAAAGAAYRPAPLLTLDGAYRLGDGTIVSLAVTPDGGLLYTETRTGDLRQLERTGPARFASARPTSSAAPSEARSSSLVARCR